MTAALIVAILVAAISALSAVASQRSASKASMLQTQAQVHNTDTTARVEMERGAYERAKVFYDDIIAKQKVEIMEFETKNNVLDVKVATQETKIDKLNLKLDEYARKIRRQEDVVRNQEHELAILRTRVATLEAERGTA